MFEAHVHSQNINFKCLLSLYSSKKAFILCLYIKMLDSVCSIYDCNVDSYWEGITKTKDLILRYVHLYLLSEHVHEKTNNLHRRKQSRRSASR